jgi:hypothetical protein|tara:strand:- start:240 stop:464 length:225 start_codon:yes stop_codon:yes gene_type:complete
MDSLNDNISKCLNTIDIEDLIPADEKDKDKVSWVEAIQILDPLIHKEVSELDKIGRKFASKRFAQAWLTMLRGH